jgi:hypothetical protein
MGHADKFLLVLLIPVVTFLLVMWWQQRYWCAETLLLCDQPREVLRSIIDLAVARWGEARPRRFRVESETPNGVVLRARFEWRPGVWQRITISAQERSIRVVSEASVPAGFGGWQNIEAVREQVNHVIDWARGRTREEIEKERQKGPLAGPA